MEKTAGLRAREYILSLLDRGETIRRIDGRVDDGFVDKIALEELITSNSVEVFKPEGHNIEMVRRKAETWDE